MLNDLEFEAYCDCLKLSPVGREYLKRVRSSPPSRRVGGGFNNVTVRYPSRKMGCIIQAESHRNELAGIYEMEYDPTVLEYYDQPESIQLEYLGRNGRKQHPHHTPDYLVLRTDSVGWEEWKMEEWLVEHAKQSPNRYVRDGSHWHCPPGVAYAEPLGFYYRLRSSAEIDWVFQRNIIFLEDYLRADQPLLSKEAEDLIRSHVVREPGINLKELLNAVEPGSASSDDVYGLIAMGRLFVDLREFPLAEPDRVPVFHSEEIARSYSVKTETSRRGFDGRPRTITVASGTTVIWDGKPLTVLHRGESTLTFLGEDKSPVELEIPVFETLVRQGKITGVREQETTRLPDEAREILARARPQDLEWANHRAEAVLAQIAGQEPPFTVAERTLSRWVANYREAGRKYGLGYIGLIDLWWRKGRREAPLPDRSRDLMNYWIGQYEDKTQPSVTVAWGKYVLACEAEHVPHASFPTFAAGVRKRPRYEQMKKRMGNRAAYKYQPFYWYLTRTTPRHGDRPFEIGHIDSSPMDLEMVCPRTGRKLGKCWATFLTDANTRRCLAFYLTFDPPSYRSCMGVLRECVRRHGRLPQIIVVDGGKEFRSTYFETLLASCECIKKTRPKAKPRAGSTCERLFGTTETEFVHNLKGNTQIMTHVRQVTKSVDPKRLAVWPLSMFYLYLSTFLYEVYDTLPHPALLDLSPREAFAVGLKQGGERKSRMIAYDDDFIKFTLPTTRRGKSMVQPNLGVKIHYLYYWSDEFRDPELEKKRVPVRYDPYDIGTAYAYIGKRWVECHSEYYAVFQGRSEREIQLATEELKKRLAEHPKNFTMTAKQLAEFLVSAAAQEVLLEQRLKDLESRQVRQLMEGGGQLDDLPDNATSPIRTKPRPPEEGIELDVGKLEVYGDL